MFFVEELFKVEGKHDEGAGERTKHLKLLMERFFEGSPILQINHKQPIFSDKYVYVTNVRWIKGKLHIRTTLKTQAHINGAVIRKVVQG
jgi:hypothetical protein